uniref:Ig-like domain-containing protein n=1 Tax=Neogobius melanostomus TaxID=47308 RepID=A0A8C6S0T8_9GOBI
GVGGKQLLHFLFAFSTASLAVWQNKTVLKGRTLELSCPIKPQSQSYPVEWKNPDGNIMFFDTYEDKRYSLVRRSESESIIRISDVTFSDGGIYTCTHYLERAEDKTVKVTVLARPKVEIITHQGKAFIKCTAEGNYPLPAISWQFKKGPEFQCKLSNNSLDEKSNTLTISTEKATHVKCLVRHPAWHSNPLVDFVIIRRNNNNVEKQTINEGSASALIFLVTCLIIGLVVVLIFIFIKLRRAHIAWKRGMKTSKLNVLKLSHWLSNLLLCLTGFFNTGITHYVVQEPAVITSVTNPHAMTAPEDRATTEEIAPVPPLHRPQKNQKSRKQSCKIYCCPQTICCLLLECK